MTGQTNDTDIVGQRLAAELGTQTDFLRFHEQLVLQVDVAESTAGLIACGGQIVIILDGGQLHGEQVLLGRGSTDNKGDVIGRTSCCSQALHLLHQERNERSLVLDGGLGHGVEIGLVGRAAALSHHDKLVFGTLNRLNVNLCGQVATGIHLVVHVKCRILGIAQVVLGEGVVHTKGERLLILKSGPYLLSFFAMDDGGACVLTEGEHALGGSLGIAEELQGHILVVLAALGIVQDGGHLKVMFATKHEFHIVEGLLCKQGQCLGGNLEHFMSLKVAHTDTFLGQQAVFGVVFALLEHGCILEFYVCHCVSVFKFMIGFFTDCSFFGFALSLLISPLRFRHTAGRGSRYRDTFAHEAGAPCHRAPA